MLLKINNLINIADFAIGVSIPKLWLAMAVTIIFAGFGRTVRGVTNSGAVVGAVVCFALLLGTGWGGFAALCAVFMVTWTATRFGYARKQAFGMAEARGGRTAAQVFANLGVAAMCAISVSFLANPQTLLALRLAMCAALCEAAADTVSSEIGQAVGGIPRLITSWLQAKPGTNGAITFAGTVAGMVAAFAVAAVYEIFGQQGWAVMIVCACAGMCGMIADSLLGATMERRGLLGNNTVNFISTLIAAAIAFAFA